MIAVEPECTAAVLPRANIAPVLRDAMFALLARHFAGVTREQFECDLAGKSHVICLHRQDWLVGFSTLQAYETIFEGQITSVIYSGDTIVAPEAWGSTMLARAWIHTVNQLRREFPRGRYYWLLLTSGFRTYRFLPVFWREFHPRHDAATPIATQRLLEHLARERFGAEFDAATGIVRFAHPQQLRDKLRDIPAGRCVDPHVAFFAKRNPGHVQGDELACLTELCPDNLTPAGRRMVAHPPA